MNVKYTFWQEEDFFIGFFNEYPDYMTQGETVAELKENLKALWDDLESGDMPYIRKVVDLDIAS
jgi:predicted RNase H-like HicB family nuclease